jgi:hypothetical protein
MEYLRDFHNDAEEPRSVKATLFKSCVESFAQFRFEAALPKEEITTQRIAADCRWVKCSARKKIPIRAARAGSRLIRMPKVRGGRFRREIISRE